MSKLKIFKASPFYTRYIDKFYAENIDLINQSYAEQYKTVMADCFGMADFWKTNLESFGQYEVMEVVTNAEVLQKAWAKEQGVIFSDQWLLEILEKQIIDFQPEIFFAHDYANINSAFIRRVKKSIPYLKLVFGWDGIGLHDEKKFDGWDLILSNIENTAQFYRGKGFKSYFFPASFETSILDKIEFKTERKIDVSFIGSINLRENFHLNRLRFIGQVSTKLPVELYVSSFTDDWRIFNRKQLRRVKDGNLRDSYYIWRVGSKNNGPVYGRKMFELMGSSRMTLNFHLEGTGKAAGNMRLMEATGVGACLVTDWKENIGDYFIPDEEVVVYRSAGEAVDKIKYLLKNEGERKKIADAGQRRALSQYSLKQRLADFSKYLLGQL